MVEKVFDTIGADCLVQLRDLTRGDVPRVGSKAANLGDLARVGYPVPDGLVLTTDAFERFLEANSLGTDSTQAAVHAAHLPADLRDAMVECANALGDVPLAVRSSGVAEDLADASFAGQYETVLDVRGPDALSDAVRQCWASAFAERVVAYQSGRGQERAGMAVLVQRLVQADAAGVAFTANPITGDRSEVVVSAVRGLGERLVSGQASPDEWTVRGPEAECRSAPEGAVTAGQARAVAELARRVEQHFGGTPQDIEWAISDGVLFLLQARPITALPEQVDWRAPGPGGWARHFRIGEWLGGPVTPLFQSWLLPLLDERFWIQNQRLIGSPPRPWPPYAVVNGWFFASMNAWNTGMLATLWSMVRSPRGFRLVAMMSPKTARRAAAPLIREWREVALPRYQALVSDGDQRVDQLPPTDLIGLVDDLATAAGDYFIWVAVVGGTGWKTEVPLARFYREHLAPRIGGSPQRLVVGLSSPTLAPHAVQSLDWVHPTLGESGALPLDPELAARRSRLQAERQSTEAEARAALAGQPKLLQKFEMLLTAAQYFAPLREEVAGSLTLGWPLMRRALLRLGATLRERGVLESADDVFFLTRDELQAAIAAEPTTSVPSSASARRLQWQRQRLLAPPLVLGEVPPLAAKRFFPLVDAVRSRDVADGGGLRGVPASPGRATGPVRVIRDLAEFGKFQPGDVLVAPATAPAWTPLFARAAAVVTDTGSVLAHASLVAREFGIPAVVGTGDATVRLRDGQLVTVDGSAGVVEIPTTELVGDANSIPLPVEPPPGYWQNVADHYPRPLTPLFRSVWLPRLDAALTHIFDEFGLLVGRAEHREIGGRLYMRFVPPGGKERPAPPGWLVPLLMPVMARLVPFMRRRIAVCVGAMRSDKPGRTVERWYDDWQPRLAARAAELRAVDLHALAEEALEAHFAAVLAFLGEALKAHSLLGFTNLLAVGEFAFACRDLLGWDEGRALELLSGLSAKSTEPARELAHMAEMARQRPAVRALLESTEDEAALGQLTRVDAEFAAALAAYQHEYGCRAIRYEVIDPTLAETPGLILRLIRDQLVRGYKPELDTEALERQRGDAIERARSALATRAAAQRERFERALARATRAYPIREDNEFYTVSQPIALLRYAAVELGRRLAAREILAAPDDVFFLELDEAWLALRRSPSVLEVDWRGLVARRKAERAWADAHPGPASYGPPPGPPPSLGWLPPEARLAMQTLIWATEQVFAAEESGREQTAGASLRGIAASPGRLTGPVRVILSEAEFARLQPGDVLVCPITSPVWSVLFPSVGALVTDTGGILSHPAIIAREYRVPAVVATGNATSLLRDGQIVTVDGGAGTIEAAHP